MNVPLSSLLLQLQAEDPERTYICGHFGQLSCDDVLVRARQLAQSLASSRETSGRRVVGISTEAPEHIACIVWAAILADISIAFLPLCRDPETLQHAMKAASVEVLLTDTPGLLQETGCLDLNEFLQRALSVNNQPESAAEADPNALCESNAGFLFQTSGTAGEPKWVKCEYRKFASVINCMRDNGALEHARGQSVFLTPPLYHSYGLSTFLEYTAVGATIIFPQGASPLGPVGDLRDTDWRGNITAIEAVPYFYSQFSKLADRFMLPALSHLGLGGGPLDKIVFDRLRELYPAVTVSVRYGMTETPSVVSQKILRASSREGWTSSGKILPVYNVEIVDDGGQLLGRNREGDIIVNGDCVGSHPGKRGNRLLTGDTGYLTDLDELVVTGRKSLYIKNRGFRISPEQVESVIAACDGVQDCRVLMVDSRLVAEVVYDDPVSDEEILAFMGARLPVYAVVNEVVRVARIPRTPSGKIMRAR